MVSTALKSRGKEVQVTAGEHEPAETRARFTTCHGKKYWTNCQVESRLLMQVEMAAAVSALRDKGSHGNAMLGEEKKPGTLPPPTVGRGRKRGRIQLRNFPQRHKDLLTYHLLMFAVFSQPV